jgi:NAD-dependent histone deacetylase SIR2
MTIHLSLDNPSQEDRLLLSTLSTFISKSKKSVIVTGAGISCNAGIPVYINQVVF